MLSVLTSSMETRPFAAWRQEASLERLAACAAVANGAKPTRAPAAMAVATMRRRVTGPAPRMGGDAKCCHALRLVGLCTLPGRARRADAVRTDFAPHLPGNKRIRISAKHEPVGRTAHCSLSGPKYLLPVRGS